MIKRTTIEIDSELLDRAKRALGVSTTRGAVEEALRRAAQGAETERARLADRQRRYLQALEGRVDVSVLASEQMWR
jgi:Arc/MetJ family transcription regulator